MTQEDKELLIKDLCARLPYSKEIVVKIGNYSDYTLIAYNVRKDEFIVELIKNEIPHYIGVIAKIIKPYLRPMSSMTEEEENEYILLSNHCIATSVGFAHIEAQILIDWLNANHFDYHGLIEKGLALEAPEGMYNK